jgi:hypothetical protein
MEHNGNNKKNPTPPPSPKKKKQKNKKTWAPWMHGALPHWLQGFFKFFFAYMCSLSFLA